MGFLTLREAVGDCLFSFLKIHFGLDVCIELQFYLFIFECTSLSPMVAGKRNASIGSAGELE